MIPPLTIEHVRQCLALPAFDTTIAEEAQRRMAPHPRPTRRENMPGSPRLAGVLILIYPTSAGLHFALMRRTEHPGVHSGQISLPGGQREGDETFPQTALRETCEEFGVCEGIELIGELMPLYVPPSDFEIHPIVGTIATRPVWNPNPTEVAEVIEVPLALLLDDSIKGIDKSFRVNANTVFEVRYYAIGDHKVWGATSAILSELETRLRHVVLPNPPEGE